ncbi:UDP-N-acetylglucosamine pyrophosphorylase [Microbotryomycetes sp. JL221]|nr:UDP-N-acetylglucosamine pyrophosphorylase [Microbotryomycetes sp. JL221]
MTTQDYDTLKRQYDAAGQGHVFTFWSRLSSQDQTSLLTQLQTIDPNKVNQVYQTAISADLVGSQDELKPPSKDRVESVLDPARQEQTREWYDKGLQVTRQGQVAVLLMAGGQGTRLGSSAPKGCYNIGLASNKSLFQLQAERIRKLQSLAQTTNSTTTTHNTANAADVIVPWYIMTSGPTRQPTEEFFQQHNHFGLDKRNIVFFEQGKIMLDGPGRVAVAPDGNGGIYAALRAPLSTNSSSSVLDDMRQRGIEYIHAYGVDNCLVRVADPTFIGYNVTRQADCGAKVVKKIDPNEAVGVIALRGNKYNVVEYSEIPKQMATATEQDGGGDLLFRAANIVNHFYTLKFLESVESFEQQMAYHVARKKIPMIDLTTAQQVKPATPNGMKLELFVFDVFPFTTSFSILEVARETDFSPLKNAPGTGSDDPDTSRRDLYNEHKRWLTRSGASVADNVEVEISPLVSYAGEGLQDKARGLHIVRSGHVEKLDDFDKLVV